MKGCLWRGNKESKAGRVGASLGYLKTIMVASMAESVCTWVGNVSREEVRELVEDIVGHVELSGLLL